MTVTRGLVAGQLLLLALLASLTIAPGLHPPAVAVGVACGLVLTTAAGRLLHTLGAGTLGPADLVTLLRAVLACGVAALVVEAAGEPSAALVALATVALVLDAVDGRVARRTRTASAHGARLDGEADAFLMLVLSVHLAPTVGGWVLAIGGARYAFGAAGLLWPWLRDPLPRRDWRKVVTAVQGVVLVGVATGALPRWLAIALLTGALGLLAESFGRDVWWLVRRRPTSRREHAERPADAVVPAP